MIELNLTEEFSILPVEKFLSDMSQGTFEGIKNIAPEERPDMSYHSCNVYSQGLKIWSKLESESKS